MCASHPLMLSALSCPALEVSLFWEPGFCLLSSPGKVAWAKGGGLKTFGPGEQGQLPVKIIRGREMPEEAPLVWKQNPSLPVMNPQV